MPAKTTRKSAARKAPSVLEAYRQRARGRWLATACWLPRPFCKRISSAPGARRAATLAAVASAS
ncbi:hypothetical protein D3C80_1758000 [compost metagenome]